MAYQRRAAASPNRIILDLDFDTLDRLLAKAKLRKVDRTRCAYELIQEALGLRETPPAAEPVMPDLDAPAFDFNRAFDSIRNYKPKDSA